MNDNITPGPWKVTKLESCPVPGYAYQVGGEGIQAHVALVVTPADARLIAVVPDLLKALRGCLDAMENMTTEAFSLGADRPQREAARAALLKAEWRGV